ncbi:hypothetical protein A3D03_04030 [Candidatus Gottesmanbacteria bacterium RIFCSPHIGHO2_02_FULL_40_13]|uniref:Acyl carrier protein n=1 Tax=Candidatus Gottesmanbacteria bacterium RIFCSPHIGHO2_02_FULL_40_13 TaxID=1798384 RepID=A0A1F6A7U2_9BACT|nr:MAG: hypothetical protein A3D03_04030 [Candidatus Gottesmanbacteria bacterium RIFCSPHIGHO2_02_FULL_40_13]
MHDNFEAIKKILSDEFGVNPESITLESKLSDDLNLSSIEVIDALSILSKEYNFQIPDDLDIHTITTVGDLIIFIEQYSDEI